mgnify:CR=1 FL=1
MGSSFWSDPSRSSTDLCVNAVPLNWLMKDMSLMVMANSDMAIFGRAALAVLAMQVTQHHIIAWVLQGWPVVQKETSWKVAVVASLPQQ